MATRLVTIEPRSVDDSVGESLREIAKFLRLDRAILWRKAADDATAGPLHYAIGHPESAHHELLAELASVQFISSKLEAGEVASFMRLDEVPDQADRDTFLRLGIRSATVIPVASTGGAGRSALFFGSTTEREWPATIVEQLRLASAVIAQALARKANLKALQGALEDLQKLQESIAEDNETGADVRVLRESRLRAGLHPENLCRRREIRSPLTPASSGEVPQSVRFWRSCNRLRPPIRQYYCWERREPVKSSSRHTFTDSARGAPGPWCA